jgi:hypothetical protein
MKAIFSQKWTTVTSKMVDTSSQIGGVTSQMSLMVNWHEIIEMNVMWGLFLKFI